jgi:hypothetical protein
MANDLITQCPDLSGSSRFDPAHFDAWYEKRPIRFVGEAITIYKKDKAGMSCPDESVDACVRIWTRWLQDTYDSSYDDLLNHPEILTPDTQKMLTVLKSKVFANPPTPAAPARILVAGDVQSGKTGAYTNLIKALLAVRNRPSFPNRYIFIVLGGVHNKLRKQTQTRLQAEFAPLEQDGQLVWLTDGENDLVAPNAKETISGTGSASYIAVVKKVASRLAAASEVLQSMPHGSDFALVIIDDECDQTTPDMQSKPKHNSRRVATLLWGDKTPTGSWTMPDRFAKGGLVYIGYTATPYSTIFLDGLRPRSMYPQTYMHVLTPGDGYMGYDHYWPGKPYPNTSLDVLEVDKVEIDTRRTGLDKFRVEGTRLEDALLWFFIAACIKRHRRAMGLIHDDDRHTSMLVNAHVKIADHGNMRQSIDTYVKNMRNTLSRPLPGGAENLVCERLLRTWEEAQGTDLHPVTAYDIDSMPFPHILQTYLPDVLENVRIVCDNSKSQERLEYPDDVSQQERDTVVEVIAVGGYTLSRGITLRGLVSSYISRVTKVVYDTYLQLSRWFGYRRGYRDLTRLWVSSEVSRLYAAISSVDRRFKKAILAAGNDPDGPFGHEQIYLGTVGGALPSSTLDSLIRSTAFIANNPYGTRLFGPTPGWDSATVDDLPLSEAVGSDVARFLDQYAGSDTDRIRSLAHFVRENEALLNIRWDVNIVRPKSRGELRFKRGEKEPPILVDDDLWFVKTPTDKKWLTLNGKPLLVVAPVLVLPPAESSGAAPRSDWIVAVVFDKQYGEADVYRNESQKLRLAQLEEYASGEDETL